MEHIGVDSAGRDPLSSNSKLHHYLHLYPFGYLKFSGNKLIDTGEVVAIARWNSDRQKK